MEYALTSASRTSITADGDPMNELQARVATTADTAELHATAPTLLLELQSLLGALSAAVTADTGRGRRPFRPNPQWSHRLGELAYGVYLLADQTGVDVADAVELTAQHLELRGEQVKAADPKGWPFEA
ncbi:MAG: hypothetical protein QOI15_31 [Pseudonocardiales bacterium]|nr:hypothetical protein [Pseudonocardiales bacterium]MDT4919129.1 hypothetical protein [Pseudonocardiales bacterium]MDT4940063.1 hypothetical protein [Pseudonocardiales bacterium]